MARAGPEGAVDRGEPLSLRLEAIRYEAEGVSTFEFRDPAGLALPPFEPGAHVDIHMSPGLSRQYSLCGSPAERDRYVVGVKRDPASRGGSTWMFDRLKVGDLVSVGSPRNQFALADGAHPSWLFAGGIGITPIRCMVEHLAAAGGDWHLYYAVARRREAAFARELARFGDRVHLHVDDEHQGRVIDLRALVASAPAHAHLYCCGPAAMLDAFDAATAGRPADRVHVERFAPKPAPAVGEGFTVALAKSGRRLRVEPGRSIAETLIDAGVPVTVSCEQGICGTCETRVVSGIPAHRDSLLSDEEKARNDVMMICCSGSLSDTLVLDL
ncbi:MAG: 2Fe-2S iron-sulfur cluster-binding protein [Lautropia sp.]